MRILKLRNLPPTAVGEKQVVVPVGHGVTAAFKPETEGRGFELELNRMAEIEVERFVLLRVVEAVNESPVAELVLEVLLQPASRRTAT